MTTMLLQVESPTFFKIGGETSLIGLFLYLIEISPLLKRGGTGPLLSELPFEVSLRLCCYLEAIILAMAVRFVF